MLLTCLVCIASSLGQSVMRWPRPPQKAQPRSPATGGRWSGGAAPCQESSRPTPQAEGLHQHLPPPPRHRAACMARQQQPRGRQELPREPGAMGTGVLSLAQVSQQPCGRSLCQPGVSHLRCPAWSRPRSAAPGAQVAPSASPPGAGPSGPSAPTHLGAETGIRHSLSRGGGHHPTPPSPLHGPL